ncbi:MAG: FKBP-type peptidyl-prolyl cis-trans isomerase [Flavobacteriales bacterium]
MKYLPHLALAAAIAILFSCNQSNSGLSNVKLDNVTDSISYAFGVQIGEQLNSLAANVDLAEINYDKLMQGIKDQRDSIAAFEPEESREFLDAEFERMYKVKLETKNKVPAEAYIATKKNEPGVQSTSSGLLYQVINQGSGLVATYGDTVSVNYTGTFIDGKEFDSSRGQAVEFPIEPDMIAGWNEGMMLMPEGSKFMLYIPWDLGYGEEGGQRIEPFTALTFEVEILKVKKAKQ